MNHYYSYFEQNLSNIKKTWQGINEIIKGKRNNNKQIKSIKRPLDKSVTHDPIEISNILNNHFATVGSNLASSLPSSSTEYTSYLNEREYRDSFFFEAVTTKEVENEISSIPNNKSCGFIHAQLVY